MRIKSEGFRGVYLVPECRSGQLKKTPQIIKKGKSKIKAGTTKLCDINVYANLISAQDRIKRYLTREGDSIHHVTQ